MRSLAEVADLVVGTELVVTGDLLLDQWVEGSARRLCREGPVPVVEVSGSSYAPGGAANAAANAAALGARVRLVGAAGSDEDSHRLLAMLAEQGVDVDDVLPVPGRSCRVKRRLLADGRLVARFDTGEEGPLPATTGRAIARRLAELAAAGLPVLLADYRNGDADAQLRGVLGRTRAKGLLLVVDGHQPAAWARAQPSAVLPDWEEVQPLLGLPEAAEPPRQERAELVMGAAERLFEVCRCDLVVVTLDADGAVLLERGRPPHRAYADHVPVASTTGAGDTFAAAFTMALAAGADPAVAVEFATLAGSQVVRSPGTSVCSREVLRSRLAAAASRPLSLAEAGELATALRAEGRRLVLTNGCFDVLHRGHVAYLNEAKRCGDVLFVGLNDDATVARLKGPGRPVNTAPDRAALLGALSCVDHLVLFPGDDATELVRAVRPHVYAKGGDYRDPAALVEAAVVREVGGETRLLSYVPEYSTSELVRRVRSGAVADVSTSEA